VVYELVMPLPLTGSQIDRHDALAEETRTWTFAAVIVVGRKFDGEVREIQLFID
jgi:hypothetical protein